ncbi:MAG: DUF1015 domain-containing protein [Verrucomicrobiota bacterium]|nr:DUF1015 domain-containing protein [Verrucomicrobiota bacterium]
MATIEPFAALRPRPELAGQICELPYDVLSSDEAREVAAGNPLSFFHVSKPEIDLPPGTGLYAPEVYAKGRDNFEKFVRQGALRRDPQPFFYLYRQVMGAHAQTGLVAAASCREYLDGVIKKHELTRMDKEDDRVRHIEALAAQSSPVFLTCRAPGVLDEFIGRKIARKPEIDFIAQDGVRHSTWTLAGADDIQFISGQFANIPFLYIADGHHRSAAAARVFRSRQGAGHSARFLAVIFPHRQLQVLPYNRVLKDLNGRTPEELLERLGAVVDVDPDGSASPGREHDLGFYLRGRWQTLSFRRKLPETDDPVDALDVTLLQRRVLEPIFGIHDPRASDRIAFVGGIRGPAELERLVDSGQYACAFSMFPTRVETLMAVADDGGIMPPKSTWFEPKLRDGLFCHLI